MFLKILRVACVVTLIILSFMFIQTIGLSGSPILVTTAIIIALMMLGCYLGYLAISKNRPVQHNRHEILIYRGIGNFMLVLGVLMILSYFTTHMANSIAVGAVFAFWGAIFRARNVESSLS
jgi:protein-S-isoprenylcysteine O-methyltransferase Ste14